MRCRSCLIWYVISSRVKMILHWFQNIFNSVTILSFARFLTDLDTAIKIRIPHIPCWWFHLSFYKESLLFAIMKYVHLSLLVTTPDNIHRWEKSFVMLWFGRTKWLSKIILLMRTDKNILYIRITGSFSF